MGSSYKSQSIFSNNSIELVIQVAQDSLDLYNFKHLEDTIPHKIFNIKNNLLSNLYYTYKDSQHNMYTIDDVIINRNDSRLLESLKTGHVRCFTGQSPYECLMHANDGSPIHKLNKILPENNLPFEIETEGYSATSNYPCMILEKQI